MYLQMVMAALEDRMFEFSNFYQTSPYGATLATLMWVAAMSSLFMSFMSLVFLKYYASVVSNRKL